LVDPEIPCTVSGSAAKAPVQRCLSEVMSTDAPLSSTAPVVSLQSSWSGMELGAFFGTKLLQNADVEGGNQEADECRSESRHE